MLAASQEAVGIYRELAAARPEEYRPNLAGALINLSVHLVGKLGRSEEALAAAQEAVGIYRQLAAARPMCSAPIWPGRWPTWQTPSATRGGWKRRWTRARKPSRSAGSWLRPTQTGSGPTWPNRWAS